MSDAHAIAARLEEYLDADYFAEAIRGIHALINHSAFLEKQVASLEPSLASTSATSSQFGTTTCAHPGVPYTIEGDGAELPPGSVVIDVDGDAWRRATTGLWECAGGAHIAPEALHEMFSPYVAVYIPNEGDEA